MPRIHTTAKLVVLAALVLAGAPTVLATTTQYFQADSDGSVKTWWVGAGTYTITVEGTYRFNYNHDDYADAKYSWSETYGPCVTWPPNPIDHNLLVNGVSPWTEWCSSASHNYQTTGVGPAVLKFQIYDDYYPDNQGSLSVTLATASVILPWN